MAIIFGIEFEHEICIGNSYMAINYVKYLIYLKKLLMLIRCSIWSDGNFGFSFYTFYSRII